MGFLSRLLGPRSQRRARPAARRAGRRVATTKRRKKAPDTLPLDKALQRFTQALTRNRRSVDGKKLVAVYHHGTCTVNHRSRQAASRCRRTS